MRNACPKCQTVYAVTPADVGRRIICTKCNAALVIDDDGFRLTDGSGASKVAPPPKVESKADDRDRPSRRPQDDDEDDSDERPLPRRRDRESDEVPARRNRPSVDPFALVKQFFDLPTAVFGVGVVLVLWFLFMPIIAGASQKWYSARVEDEQLAHEAELQRLRDRGTPENIPKLEEEWRKRKEKLERDEKWVGIKNRQGEYWDRAGSLFGFIVTAVGSIGMLTTYQPTVKKVVGAVVVSAMMLLVFITFVVKG